MLISSREPTAIRRSSINAPPPTRKKTPSIGRFCVLVEVVGVEPTSYSAAKKLSTYLVYLLFLNRTSRVNTLGKTQKAEYSYKNTFRFF